MSAAGMAAFEARAGTGIVRAFANAVADFGNGLAVEVVYSDPADNSLLGGLPVAARDPRIALLEADLGARHIGRGTRVSVRGRAYLLRNDPVDVELGTLECTLELEQP